MTFRSNIAPALLGALGVLAAGRTAGAVELELRVLVVATGSAEDDPGRALIEETLENLGVPFDVLDARSEALTADVLAESAERGRYNGIILTEAEALSANGTTALSAEEIATLHAYERDFGVRESVLTGFPATNAALGVDFGLDEITAYTDLQARWTGRAGGTEIFEYVNTENPLEVRDFSFTASVRDDGVGPVVEPLLVDADNPDQVLISALSYEDGREVLLSTLAAADFLHQSHLIAYEMVNFATSGLFIGARHAYLSIHNDDLFLADALWDADNQREFPEDVATYRWGADEVPLVAATQQAFRERHPLAPDVVIELAFNGVGSDLQGDPLTQAIVAHGADFAFINHTFEALQMDWLCGGFGGCVRTDVQTATEEIQRNAQRWLDLGLPNPDRALQALLTDSHSGLEDRLGTDDPSDDIHFPEGFNPALGEAAQALGIRMLAGDTSRPGQTQLQRIPGFELVLLPRHPTSVFYNVTTPVELESEYNYIFHDSYLEDGEDPCEIPEALCETRTYDEILDEEAAIALDHILSSQPFPHYFHQSNLHVYDEAGNILQFDWLERVVSAYEQELTLPLQSPLFHELVDVAWNTVLARELEPEGVVDTETGSVTLSASGPVSIEVTGIAGGSDYGGQSIALLSVSPEATQALVDAALER